MSFSRKVEVIKNDVYQADCGVDQIVFTLNKKYKNLDLSALNAYLKINYSDDTGDKIALIKQADGDRLNLVWELNSTCTQVSGVALCQISFENSESTIVFNTEVFEIEIKPSVTVDLCNIQAVPSAIQQLQTKLQQSLDYVEGVIESGLVRKVNGESGDVVISTESLGAVSEAVFESELNKIENGERVVLVAQTAHSANHATTADSAQSASVSAVSTNATIAEKAISDGNGNVISSTYLKASMAPKTEWAMVADEEFENKTNTFSMSFVKKYKKLFIRVYYGENTSGLSVDGRLNLKTRISNDMIGLSIPPSAFVTRSGDVKVITYDIEMKGRFAVVQKIMKVFSSGFDESANEIDLATTPAYHATQTLGIDLSQNYIDNFELSFIDGANNFGFNSYITVYGVEFTE